MRRPVLVAVVTASLLIVAGPAIPARELIAADQKMLPPDNRAPGDRAGATRLRASRRPIGVIAEAPAGDPAVAQLRRSIVALGATGR